MAKHIVKCKVCGCSFDTNSEQAVKCGPRRYAHFKCMPEGEKVPMENIKQKSVDADLLELKKYIGKIYGNKANWALINKQIKNFESENKFSYSGMKKSLTYFYEVKGNDPSKSNGGIGIIEYTYQDAYNYYLGLFLAQQATADKSLVTNIKEIIVKPFKSKGLQKKMFDLGELENEE